MAQENQLQVILTEQGIDKTDASKLVEAFGGPFEEAGEVLQSYKSIVVTDRKQTDKMAEAREKRLLLKKARTTVENKRKELKADIVKQGKAIDSVARFVKEQIQPAEEYLELQEKFAEIEDEKVAAELKAARIEKLSKYSDDLSVYNLDDMSEEQFNTLLANLKAQHEAKLAEEKRLEEERIAKEKEEEKARAEQAKENERLKAEAEKRAEADRKAEEEKARKDQVINDIVTKMSGYRNGIETVEAGEEALKKVNDFFNSLDEETQQDPRVVAITQDSRLQIRTTQDMIREKAVKKAEEDRIAREAEEKRIAEEAERKAMLAPDKDKLMQFAAAMELIRTEKLPAMKTKQGQDVVNEIDGIFTRLHKFITTKANEL